MSNPTYKIGDILVYVRNSDKTKVTGIVSAVRTREDDKNHPRPYRAGLFDNVQLRDETVAYTLHLSADESERIGHPVTLGESRVVSGAERLPADAWPEGWPVVEGQPGGPVYRIFGDLMQIHFAEAEILLGWRVTQWAFPGSDVLFREDPASRVVRKVQPWIYGNYASALAEVDRLRAENARLRVLASEAREIITDECPRVAGDWLAAAEKEID